MLVTTFAAGAGKGKARRDDDTAGAKYIDFYIGIGIAEERPSERSRWFAPSAGIAANRIWLGDRDGAWFLGSQSRSQAACAWTPMSDLSITSSAGS